MPKRIYIVRHAKSSWSNMSLPDKERPLNKRGKNDAPRMAAWCVKNNYIPDIIISSTALRAYSTANEFVSTMEVTKEKYLKFDALYHAPAQTYLETCYGLDESISSVMLFGHNPGITYLANNVSNEFIDNVPTCGILVIDSSASLWAEVDFSNCTLNLMKVPKSLVP